MKLIVSALQGISITAAIVLMMSQCEVVNANNAEGARCVKWRATNGCDAHGTRNSWYDASCTNAIKSGSSGYCECENRRRVREVDCDHHPFTCEEACKQDASAELHYPTGMEKVTCGSTIKLVHEESRFRLHSHEVNYGTGSGQQSVTAHRSRGDVNSYWLVKEGDGEMPCQLGTPIQCNTPMRLEHIQTRRNLHTHRFGAPLSPHNLEVSAFGVAGDGDRGDTWLVECEDSQQCVDANSCDINKQQNVWYRDALVRLKNLQSQVYLQTDHALRFDNSNCPRCPIIGQQEVCASHDKNDKSLWFAGEGVYIGS